MGKNHIVLLYTSEGTGLASKNWKRLSSVKNNKPYLAKNKLDNGKEFSFALLEKFILRQLSI